jgi:hypothetical protein
MLSRKDHLHSAACTEVGRGGPSKKTKTGEHLTGPGPIEPACATGTSSSGRAYEACPRPCYVTSACNSVLWHMTQKRHTAPMYNFPASAVNGQFHFKFAPCPSWSLKCFGFQTNYSNYLHHHKNVETWVFDSITSNTSGSADRTKYKNKIILDMKSRFMKKFRRKVLKQQL